MKGRAQSRLRAAERRMDEEVKIIAFWLVASFVCGVVFSLGAALALRDCKGKELKNTGKKKPEK